MPDVNEIIADLCQAMKDTMAFAGGSLLPDCTPAAWHHFSALYMADPCDFQDRCVLDESTLAQQRGLRARAVFEQVGLTGFNAPAEQRWVADFEKAQPLHIRAFDDVLPLRDAVKAATPRPENFLEGCRQLGTAPEETLHVGDNFVVDGVGWVKAGLLGVWLHREGKELPVVQEADAACAGAAHSIGSLAQLELLGLAALPHNYDARLS